MRADWRWKKINSNDNFIRLINQYQNLIFSICLKLTGDYFTAEDMTQEMFLAAYKNYESLMGRPKGLGYAVLPAINVSTI